MRAGDLRNSTLKLTIFEDQSDLLYSYKKNAVPRKLTAHKIDAKLIIPVSNSVTPMVLRHSMGDTIDEKPIKKGLCFDRK